MNSGSGGEGGRLVSPQEGWGGTLVWGGAMMEVGGAPGRRVLGGQKRRWGKSCEEIVDFWKERVKVDRLCVCVRVSVRVCVSVSVSPSLRLLNLPKMTHPASIRPRSYI